MAKKFLTKDLEEDCKRVGVLALQSWFKENQVSIPGEKNFFDSLETALADKIITIERLQQAIVEMEENSDKKIFLMRAKDFKLFETDKKAILRHIQRKFGHVPSNKNWISGKATKNPTFIYLFWEDGILKIKYAEQQIEVEADFENGQFIRVPKKVCIIIVVDTKTGLVQLRMDTPGNVHVHKNDLGKITDSAYEEFYKERLKQLFPEIKFEEYNLVEVANHISLNEKDKFRINKGVTTITNNAKQTYATAGSKSDVRDLPEYEAALAKGAGVWRTEELTGYWTEGSSDGELTRDLFMRISRKASYIRVQRGCLEKELNYGIGQIREIQKNL